MNLELRELWNQKTAGYFLHNGSDSSYPYDIASHPEFAKLLRNLADVYLPLCEYKFELLQEKKKLEFALTEDDDPEQDTADILIQLDKNETAIKEFDIKLVHVNAASLKRILQHDDFNAVGGRDRRDAVRLLGPIIKLSVAAACEHSGYITSIGDDPRLLAAVKEVVPPSFSVERE